MGEGCAKHAVSLLQARPGRLASRPVLASGPCRCSRRHSRDPEPGACGGGLCCCWRLPGPAAPRQSHRVVFVPLGTAHRRPRSGCRGFRAAREAAPPEQGSFCGPLLASAARAARAASLPGTAWPWSGRGAALRRNRQCRGSDGVYVPNLPLCSLEERPFPQPGVGVTGPRDTRHRAPRHPLTSEP